MKAIKLTGIRQMEVMEVPVPQIINDTDVLIKMASVGVCGSDLHYYTDGGIGSQKIQYPFTVGHEGAGIITEVGKAVTRVKPGDRIAVEPAMSCGKCDQCLSGREHTCRKIRFLGCPGQAEGCLAEYLVMPEECCFLIPDHMTMDEAAISEPLAIGVYAVKRSIPMKGAKVGILGFGPIGMSVLLPALAQGADAVYVIDKIPERIEMAKKLGAKWAGSPEKEDVVRSVTDMENLQLDVVFECCGKQEALDNAVELVKPGGKIMIIGIPEFQRWSFSVDRGRHKEITITNVRRQVHCVDEALDLIANKKIDVTPMATHHYKLDQTHEAFKLVENYKDGVMKAMIHFD